MKRTSSVFAIMTTAVVIITASSTWTESAHAQPDDRRAPPAQVLFDQAKTLVQAGKFAEACPKFAESMRLDPGIGTSLWLADCYENNGQTASAWAQFKVAAASAAMSHDAREKIAKQRAAILEKRLSHLQINIPENAKVPGLTVARDGVAVGAQELGIPLPVDPGTHVITAAAPDRVEWKSSVTIPTKVATTTVNIPLLAAAETSSSASPVTTPPKESDGAAASTVTTHEPTTSPPPQEGEQRGGTQRLVGLVIAGVGLASVGVGTYFSFSAKSSYDKSNDDGHCKDNRCDTAGKDFRSDASSKATIATILMGVGAAAVIGGGVLWLTAPSGQRTAITVAPSLHAQGGDLVLSGHF